MCTSSSIRLLLACSVFLYPFSAVRAQEPSSKPAIPDAFLTPQAVVAASLRPHQVLTNPNLQMLPVEIAAAAGQKYLGMELANIGRAIAVVEPPFGQTPLYAVVLQANEPFDLAALSPEITGHTKPGEIGGRDGLVSMHPALPCYMVLGSGKTLIAASQPMLEKLLDRNRPDPSGVLADLIARQSPGDDLYLAVDLESLRPLVMMGMAGASQQTPPEFQKFLNIPRLLQSAEAVINLNTRRPSRLVTHAANQQDADRLTALIEEGTEVFRAKMRAEMADDLNRLRNSEDPVERATAAYMERMTGDYVNGFTPQRDGNSLKLFETDLQNAPQMTSVALVGFLIAATLPAVQAAREAARRTQSMNNMKQLLLALHNYHDVHGSFPPYAIHSPDGKPLLSWRVAILPYLEEQQGLYEQFHLDEPWDSPHNQALISQMPPSLLDPSSSLLAEEGRTHYLAPVGEGLLFEKQGQGTRLRDVTDGLSQTLAILQVNDDAAQTWTKPADWAPAPADPLAGLVGPHPGIFLAGRADGSVTAIAEDIDPQAFKAMLTRAGDDVQ